MANKFQLKRTTVSGRTANTTNNANTSFIDKGELAVNLADRKVFSSDSSNAIFEVGSNLSSLSVGSIVANGSLGTSGQVLTTNSSGVYWATASGGVNADQVTYTYTIASNTTVISGADDATRTLSYTAGLESVFINGSRQISGVDYNTTNSAAITLTSNVIAGEVVQVITWQGAVNSANVAAQYTWTNTHTFSNTVTFTGAISANGTLGTAGQVLHSNGTAVYWAADDNAGGTVTSIATANGLSGGTITSSGTLGVTTGSTLTVNTTGIHVNSALSITSLALAGALSGVTTLAAGNTTITGFVNATSTVNASGLAVGTSFIANTTRVVIGTAVGLQANGGIGTAGQVLTSNATTVYWSTPTTGTVTSIATANGLSGGTITSSGTLGVTTGPTLTVNTTGIHVNSTLSLTDLTISGNLTVSGTRTYVNTTTLDVGDNIVTLNADLGAVAPTQDAGIEVMRGTSSNVQFMWDETNDRWSTNGQPLAISSLVATGLATISNNLFLSGGGDVVISSAGVGGATANTSFYNDASDLYINVNNAIRAYIASNGNFGVGNTTPTDKFRVDGNVSYSGTLFTAGISANGSVGSAGQILTSNGSQAYWQTQQFRTAGQTVISANTTLDSTYLGENILVVTADITITLPSSGFDSGTLAFISNVSGGKVNLSYAYAGDGPTVLYPNDSVILCTDGNGASLYWRQYSYTNALQLEPIVAVSALDVDCSKGTYFTKTVAANSTFTFSNVPTSVAYSFTLEVTHTSGTITWPAAVKWPSDTAPTLTTGKTHLFMFTTSNGGTRWRGSALVDYVN